MTAIVLSGGGARGSYQVGVLLGFWRRAIRAAHIYGTSVGALNAAGYAHKGPNELVRIWHSIRSKNDILANNLIPFSYGIHNTRPLRKIIESNIDAYYRIPATVTRVNLLTGKLEYVTNRDVSLDEFKLAIEQSSAQPPIMSPIKWCVDGGVREITPLRRAIDDGFNEIMVILASPLGGEPQTWKKPSRFFGWVSVGLRSIDILTDEIFLNDLKHCKNMGISVKVLAPEIDLFDDSIDFDPVKIRRAIEMGETAARDYEY